MLLDTLLDRIASPRSLSLMKFDVLSRRRDKEGGGGEFHLQFNPVLIVRMGSINWKILFRMGVVTPQNFRSVTDRAISKPNRKAEELTDVNYHHRIDFLIFV